MNRGDVAEIESQLVNEKRLKNLKIYFPDVSPEKDYDFAEFFYQVRQGILRYHSGVGDIIHSVIMKNNGIAEILTFDEKNAFQADTGFNGAPSEEHQKRKPALIATDPLLAPITQTT